MLGGSPTQPLFKSEQPATSRHSTIAGLKSSRGPVQRRAADFLNVNHVDVLSVQHEYGIFGASVAAVVAARWSTGDVDRQGRRW